MGKKYNLSFCEKYQYPPEIRQQLTTILGDIDKYISLENVHSVLLLGSTPRGELSYRYENEKLDIFSDYDMLIITKRRKTMAERELKMRLKQREVEFCRDNPLFQIDVGCLSLARFKIQASSVWTYETKENSVCIYGRDVRHLLPQVTVEKLDLGNTNELILIRLWNMLLYIPQNVVLGRQSEYENIIFKYIQARNALDITTIFLPNVGIFLPTYTQRVEYILRNCDQLKFQEIFGETFAEFLSTCLKGRRNNEFYYSLIEMYRNTLAGYTCLIKYILQINRNTSIFDICEHVIAHSLKLNDRGIKFLRRYILEFTAIRRHLSEKGVLSSIRWLLLKKKEPIICFLLNMHYALLSEMLKESHLAALYLKKAENYFYSFALSPFRKSDFSSFSQKWLYLRKEFVNFMWEWFFYFVEGKKQSFSKILEFNYG